MAFLLIGSMSVAVAARGLDVKYVTIGESGTRSMSGTYRVTRRAVKREWTVTTAPMLPADANALITALGDGGPITLSGDVVQNASVTVFPEVTARRLTSVKGGHRAEMTFTLYEG